MQSNNSLSNKEDSIKNKVKKSKEIIEISKTLSSILRHNAKNYNLKIESSGYVEVNELLNLQTLKKKKLTFELLQEIVNSCEKQRFQLENRPPYYIRATQGHSMSIVKNDETLKKLENYTNYPIVVHGTNLKSWEVIKIYGLNKMKRNCIRNLFHKNFFNLI
jgi:2'-phosphotransferase